MVMMIIVVSGRAKEGIRKVVWSAPITIIVVMVTVIGVTRYWNKKQLKVLQKSPKK